MPLRYILFMPPLQHCHYAEAITPLRLMIIAAMPLRCCCFHYFVFTFRHAMLILLLRPPCYMLMLLPAIIFAITLKCRRHCRHDVC